MFLRAICLALFCHWHSKYDENLQITFFELHKVEPFHRKMSQQKASLLNHLKLVLSIVSFSNETVVLEKHVAEQKKVNVLAVNETFAILLQVVTKSSQFLAKKKTSVARLMAQMTWLVYLQKINLKMVLHAQLLIWRQLSHFLWPDVLYPPSEGVTLPYVIVSESQIAHKCLSYMCFA